MTQQIINVGLTANDNTGDTLRSAFVKTNDNFTEIYNTQIFTGGTANGVLFLNGSKVATSGSALTFDGTNLGVGANITASAAAAPSFTVGTGSGSPAITLYSSTTGASQISFADATSGAGAYDGYVLYNQNSQYMAFGIAATEQMRLTSKGLLVGYTSDASLSGTGNAIFSGNLGIGTSSPVNKLVVSNAGANGLEINPISGISSGASLNGYNRSTLAFTPLTYAALAHYFQVGSTPATAATLDSSGNLGLGVTPSAWSVTPVIEFGTGGAIAYAGANGSLLTNAYYNGGWIYKTTAAATWYNAQAGQHTWYTAPSGTAGNAISFTQAMTLYASGGLSVGNTTDPGVAGRISAASLALTNGNLITNLVPQGTAETRLESYNGGATGFVTFYAGNTERMRLDSSGNLGLGVTPSAWDSAKALQVNARSSLFGFSNDTHVAYNNYYSATGYRYIASDFASDYQQTSGQHRWFTAPSGTAGNAISFTQSMTLDASGNFYVGTTSQSGGSNITFNQPANADMKIAASVSTGTRAAYQVFVNTTVTTVGTENSTGGSLATGTSAYATVLANSGAYPICFATSNNERARITSGGDLLVGTTTSGGKGIVVGSQYGGVDLSGGGGSYAQWGGGYGIWPWNNVGLGIGSLASIGFVINGGTEAARITSGGDLVVGGTAPVYTAAGRGVITINGSSQALVGFTVGGADKGFLYHTGTDMTLSNTAAGAAIFQTNNTERARITSGGNVGIGTTDPSRKLTISRATEAAAEQLEIRNVGGISTGNYDGIVWTQDATGSTALASIRVNYLSSGATNMAFNLRNNANVLFLEDGGNVGVGTNDPGTKFDVASTQASGITLRYDTTASYRALITPYWNSGTDTRIDFAINNAGGATPSVYLSVGYNGGNVGVGTTTPAYKLEVNGSFAATTKSFVINHPTKPGKKLRYGSLEGPENGVYVRGKVTGNVIELPDYWTKLVDPDSITVNLTPIGRHQDLYVEDIVDNKVIIRNGNLMNKEINCYYTVFAERVDVEKLEVEIG